MQKMWSRAVKTRAYHVGNFLGAEVEGDKLIMNYDLLQKRKRFKKRNRYF